MNKMGRILEEDGKLTIYTGEATIEITGERSRVTIKSPENVDDEFNVPSTMLDVGEINLDNVNKPIKDAIINQFLYEQAIQYRAAGDYDAERFFTMLAISRK